MSRKLALEELSKAFWSNYALIDTPQEDSFFWAYEEVMDICWTHADEAVRLIVLLFVDADTEADGWLSYLESSVVITFWEGGSSDDRLRLLAAASQNDRLGESLSFLGYTA